MKLSYLFSVCIGLCSHVWWQLKIFWGGYSKLRVTFLLYPTSLSHTFRLPSVGCVLRFALLGFCTSVQLGCCQSCRVIMVVWLCFASCGSRTQINTTRMPPVVLLSVVSSIYPATCVVVLCCCGCCVVVFCILRF